MEFLRVESGEDAVAPEDEALRTEGVGTVVLRLEQKVQLAKVGTADEG